MSRYSLRPLENRCADSQCEEPATTELLELGSVRGRYCERHAEERLARLKAAEATYYGYGSEVVR